MMRVFPSAMLTQFLNRHLLAAQHALHQAGVVFAHVLGQLVGSFQLATHKALGQVMLLNMFHKSVNTLWLAAELAGVQVMRVIGLQASQGVVPSRHMYTLVTRSKEQQGSMGCCTAPGGMFGTQEPPPVVGALRLPVP